MENSPVNGGTGSVTSAATGTFWFGQESEAAEALQEGSLLPLFAVRYGGGTLALPCPVLEVPNALLDGEPCLELWRSGTPVERRRAGRFELAIAGDLLFAGCRWPLDEGLEAETRALYRELLALAQQEGRPGLLRLWNYLPGINEEQADQERYRLFNAGRAAGFAERFGAGAERRYCASSAVGAPGEALVAALLATRDEGLHLENPRQVPAWRYPRSYGPTSPSFARATMAPPRCAGLERAVLVSGTASIVGHESRHRDDLLAQLDETFANLEAILEFAGRRVADLDFVKIYLRHPEDLARVRERVAERLRPDAQLLWLQAEICRAELLLEIEGIAF